MLTKKNDTLWENNDPDNPIWIEIRDCIYPLYTYESRDGGTRTAARIEYNINAAWGPGREQIRILYHEGQWVYAPHGKEKYQGDYGPIPAPIPQEILDIFPEVILAMESLPKCV
jgi:hypothetical protein